MVLRCVISLVSCHIGLPEPTYKFSDGSFTSSMPGNMYEKGTHLGTGKGRAEDRRRDQMSLVVETDKQKKRGYVWLLQGSRTKCPKLLTLENLETKWDYLEMTRSHL